ncbi:signal recognition particle protein [Candidatus Magnetominusculus xianensis]|uniref:Signal recognition particle protein n=1 Tax=Candidatus Magnetominusculus xianensis TaxID=1748249 RepID=A0ABR5SJQ4_9BACT|nr:signal recognition particle protein [Candidatus Magnetominusculus xianensis]KWT92767.1 signal recognition particle protein [Candidatus Magnetominusculus xianensis]MBF0405221.1 signal recognition particle protein [Nitrospirota bacterium]
MFNSLSEKLESVFRKLKGKGVLVKDDIDAAMKEIRFALLEADVNFKVVKGFIDKVKEKSLGKGVLESLTPGQQVIKIVNDELCVLLGSENEKIRLSPNPPTVIMMIGLHGSGKTTTSAKLARHFKAQGRRPMLAAADLQRPAAIDQLITLGKQIDVPVFFSKEDKIPAVVCKNALNEAKKQARDIIILDTAGRLHIAEDLMKELKAVKDAVTPDEILFVADAMTGQDAVNIAKTFNEKIGIDGIILTKMDGDARGGAALSIREVTGRPIKFIGTGEKIDMLEPFHPERAASRILGMGDVLSFIEKAQQSFDDKEAQALQNKLTTDSFTLDDLREQLKKIRSMGPIQNLLNMIPGFNRMKGVEVDESQFIKVEAMISSMTRKERNNPQILNGSRKLRISAGSGTTVADVNRLLKQYKDMRKMMKVFKNKKGFKIPDIMPF